MKIIYLILVTIFAIFSFNSKTYAQELITLGEYPTCEPSSAIITACSDSSNGCLIVGDNEVKTDLFSYVINRDEIPSSNFNKINLNDQKISDIESLVELNKNELLVFGSHSRNSKCELKKNRRRFLHLKLSRNGAANSINFAQTTEIQSNKIFNDSDVKNNPLLQAVASAIDVAERKGTEAEGNKNNCQLSNSFNAEGALNFQREGAIPSIWIGLRSPLLSNFDNKTNHKDLAILMHMTNINQYQFDKVVFLDLKGRGIRELTTYKDKVWGIAGGPEDGKNNFFLWNFAIDLLQENSVIHPKQIKTLPASAEGLRINNSTAYITIDGDQGKSFSCQEPGKLMIFNLDE